MSIKVAEFFNGPLGQSSGEVIVGGRRPYFYSYDTASGSLIKVPGKGIFCLYDTPLVSLFICLSV
jgi:hypothetical protein